MRSPMASTVRCRSWSSFNSASCTHVGSSYYYDVGPSVKSKLPTVWVNRKKEKPDDPKAKKPDLEVKNLRDLADKLKA